MHGNHRGPGFRAKLIALAGCMALSVFAVPPGMPPAASEKPAPAAAVTGIYNWIHSTADADRGFAFYHDVFGIELVNSPFGSLPADAPPGKIRPRAEAVKDEIVGDLTDTHGARFRNVFMKLPSTAFGFELSEFNDIPQRTIVPNFWDSGATTLILWVRDIDAVFTAIQKAKASVVTLSGKPLRMKDGQLASRSVIVRDPDGYLIQVVQAAPEQIAKASGTSPVVEAGMGVTVADLEKAKRFYSGLLGFGIGSDKTFTHDKAVLDLVGLRHGEFRKSLAKIPGTSARVEFYEFRDVFAKSIRWKIQDPGAPQFQFQVKELEPLIDATKAAGFSFVSLGAKPIKRAAGRFIFTQDADGVLVEYMHPTPK
jgi:catechol 2,3-dioxygenase-like lactoylglutathione lyase family enzyme